MPHRTWAVAVVIAALGVAPRPAGALAVGEGHRPPVDAPPVEAFRAPATPFAPGNRGVDYATSPGDDVRASAAGLVVFAGPVAGDLHVVVRHGDGLRTSYSFLAGLAVRAGDRVASGQPVGRAGERLHWGVRAGEAYLDPLLLVDGPPLVHLAPEDGALLDERGEESALRRYLDGVLRLPGRVATSAADWARRGATAAADGVGRGTDALGIALDHAVLLGFPSRLRSVARAWQLSRRPCTPEAAPAPAPGGGRLLVQVGGLGSESGKAAVLDLDEAALGYRPEDTVQYSYRGGVAADLPYGPDDTTGDLRVQGRRLRALLDHLARAHPGRPIDVVAHSQGGLVAREALRSGHQAVGRLVTLATPHNGANIATVGGWLSRTRPGAAVVAGAETSGMAPFDLDGRSLGQLSETSDFIASLAAAGPPPGIPFTSIAAANDLVVPPPRCWVVGATNVVLGYPAPVTAHDALPGHAQRHVALALAGAAPACVGFLAVLGRVVAGEAISAVEHVAGAAATLAAHGFDTATRDMRGRRAGP